MRKPVRMRDELQTIEELHHEAYYMHATMNTLHKSLNHVTRINLPMHYVNIMVCYSSLHAILNYRTLECVDPVQLSYTNRKI